MKDYRKYINALRKCANEHDKDQTPTFNIVVSDLCRDTANLLEALEQEPTTKNDLGVDCISRADAIGCLAGQIELSPSNVASVHEYLKCVDKRLHDLPSVTPQEPRKGHWTYIRNSEINGLKIVECSECGKRSYGSGNYCPNCGAKMADSEGKE